jgi:hypothetical protein
MNFRSESDHVSFTVSAHNAVTFGVAQPACIQAVKCAQVGFGEIAIDVIEVPTKTCGDIHDGQSSKSASAMGNGIGE